MEKISFLLGSGFSVPAGYPTASELNKRLRCINQSEICVHSGREAFFLNGQKDLNASIMGVEQRLFVQEFLEFYTSKILQSVEEFHYETFYDYYIAPYITNIYPAELSTFLENFRKKNKVMSDKHHLLMEFNDNFSQLLAQLLSKPLELVHQCSPYDPRYRNFLFLLEAVSKNHSVHIHTLNHDLYFESLSYTDCIQGKLADGFDYKGSNIYVLNREIYSKHMVRLRRFIDKYDEPFCLYKLHGSIDNYWVSFGKEIDLVKLYYGLSVHEFHKEILKDGNYQYVHAGADVVPDFLSGTTHKIDRYSNGNYYPQMLEHFRINLEKSNVLIVVGYGFRDKRINDYIEQYFLNDPKKVLIVVDVVQPASTIFTKPNVRYFGGGVSNMALDKIIAVISHA